MSKYLSAHRRTNRRGLTLVEVLVIISILGMLTAIALPAVNRARETGRRNICTNNFRQFGTALVAFEATHGVYPSANSNGPYFRDKPAYPYHVLIPPHVFLLPHLDLNDLYQSFQIPTLSQKPQPFSKGIFTKERVAVFRCPSDPQEFSEDLPGNNIRVCIGVYLDRTGPFLEAKFQGSRDIVDGISRSVAASERLMGSGQGGTFDRRRDVWYSGVNPIVTDPDVMSKICGSLTIPDPIYYPESGRIWAGAGFVTTWYNHVATPNSDIPDCIKALPPPKTYPNLTNLIIIEGSYRATSNHPGGVNVVFLDAHTEFIINDVELPIWRALGTIAGAD